MPTSSGEYVGDQAGVLPSNTAAVLNFSDQFARQAAIQQREQMMQQREDMMMRNRVNSAINSQIFNPNFGKTDGSNPQIQQLMGQTANETRNILKNQGEEAAYTYLYNKVPELNNYHQVLKQANDDVATSAAAYMKNNPTANKDDLIHLIAQKKFFKTDANGNNVPKDLSEINPYDENLTQDALKGHEQDLYGTTASGDALNTFVKGQAIENPTQQPVVINGVVKSPGYSAKKFPSSLMDIVPGADGKYAGKTKSVPYSMDGNTPYVDENGKTINVLPQNIVTEMSKNPALRSPAERLTQQDLDNLNATGLQIDRNSAYGNMLYQKYLYDMLDNNLNGKYIVNTDDGSKLANQQKKQAFTQAMQQNRYNLSVHNSGRLDQALSDREKKQALTNPDGTPLKYDYDTILGNKQTDNNSIVGEPKNPYINTGTPLQYVDVTNVDPTKINRIGNIKTDKAGNVVSGVPPIVHDGRKYYLVTQDANGNDALSNGNNVIDRDEANIRQIKAMPKGNKTILQRTRDAVNTAVSKWSKFKR